MNENIVVGQTRVNVFKREVNDMTGKEKITKIKTGVIIQDFGTFVRVFDNRSTKDGGDPHQNVEVFAVAGKNIWCEYLDELKPFNAVPVPVSY